MLRFHKKYFLLSLLLFLLGIFIAFFVHDAFIRPHIGDFLVVIFIYTLLKSFLRLSTLKLGLFTLLIAYFAEILQYWNLLDHLNLQNSKAAHLIFGNSFDWLDMLAYTLGILLVMGIEKMNLKNKCDKNKA